MVILFNRINRRLWGEEIMKKFLIFLFLFVVAVISFSNTIYSYGPFEEVYTEIYELEEHQERFLFDRNQLLYNVLLRIDSISNADFPVYLTNLEFPRLADHVLKKPAYDCKEELNEDLVTVIKSAGILSLYMEAPEKVISGFHNIPDFISLFYTHLSGKINLNRSFSRYYSLDDVDYFEELSDFITLLGSDVLKLKEKGFNSTINLSLYYSSYKTLICFNLYYDREKNGGLIVSIVEGMENSYD